MSTVSLEGRVAALEAEVPRLKEEQTISSGSGYPWWEAIRGTCRDDPIYDEAMRLGREWRESQRSEEEMNPAP